MSDADAASLMLEAAREAQAPVKVKEDARFSHSTMSHHSFSLPDDALQRSVVQPAAAHVIGPLLSRLDAGLPVTLVILGSSVAEQGGCLQAHEGGDPDPRRCKAFREGFAIRLHRFMNATWPHPGHRLVNAAIGMYPLARQGCLFTRLPQEFHIAVLDFGSMAGHVTGIKPHHIEMVARRLLDGTRGQAVPPLLVFLSLHMWCRPHTGQRKELLRYDGWSSFRTPWMRMQNETIRICREYGQLCISQHAALFPPFAANKTGFHWSEIVSGGS